MFALERSATNTCDRGKTWLASHARSKCLNFAQSEALAGQNRKTAGTFKGVPRYASGLESAPRLQLCPDTVY